MFEINIFANYNYPFVENLKITGILWRNLAKPWQNLAFISNNEFTTAHKQTAFAKKLQEVKKNFFQFNHGCLIHFN